jgi:hypothetical protein
LQQSAEESAPLLIAKLQLGADKRWHEVLRVFLLKDDWPNAEPGAANGWPIAAAVSAEKLKS